MRIRAGARPKGRENRGRCRPISGVITPHAGIGRNRIFSQALYEPPGAYDFPGKGVGGIRVHLYWSFKGPLRVLSRTGSMVAVTIHTALMVEDDASYARFVTASIAKANLPMKVHHVPNLAEAMRYLQGEQTYADREAYPFPTIVLLDVNLSGESGFPVLSWLQQNGYLQDDKVRVVMLTASGRSEDIQQALELGATSYMIKSPLPGRLTELLAKFAGSTGSTPPEAGA